MTLRKTTFTGLAALLLAGSAPGALAQDMGSAAPMSGEAVSMRDAIAVAMQSNPEVLQAQFNVVTEFPASERGEGGYGSTGKS